MKDSVEESKLNLKKKADEDEGEAYRNEAGVKMQKMQKMKRMRTQRTGMQST